MDKAKLKQKNYYDMKAKAVKISVGDYVLVRKLAFQGKHKIADKFEEETYKVIEQPRSEFPVYKIEGIETKRERTMHRNHLLRLDRADKDVNSEGEDIDINIETDASITEGDIGKTEDAAVEIKSDITRRKIDDADDVHEDDDSDSDGFEFVVHANLHGDAHDKPETDSNLEVVTENTELTEKSVHEVTEEVSDIVLDDTHHSVHSSISGSQTEQLIEDEITDI